MENRRIVIASAVLALLVLAVYFPVLNHDYQIVDDNKFLQDAPYFSTGITLENIQWATRSDIYIHWCPLAWLSHMIDCELFGDRPGLHLMHSVALFALMAVLLFLALHAMTGAFWRSFFVAGLFALHPINVETNAWLTERHNLLAGVFFAAALLSYARYSSKPGALRYLAVLLFTAASLASKTSLVTMPFIFLLFDFWPLKRLAPGLHYPDPGDPAAPKTSPKPISLGFLLLEKIPIALVTAVGPLITISNLVTMEPATNYTISQRLMNIPVAYVSYIAKLFWPQGLAPYYPFPSNLPVWQVSGAVFILVTFSLVAIWQVRRRPYFFMGWFFFLGVLVPIIGIVGTTVTASADRFVFVPAIGIFILVSWGVADLMRHWPALKRIIIPACIVALMALALTAATQVRLWKNSETIYTHALSVTKDNYFAWMTLGEVQRRKKNYGEALKNYQKAISTTPKGHVYQAAYTHTALVYQSLGQRNKAEEWFLRAIQVMGIPNDTSKAMANLGAIRIKQKRYDEAMVLLSQALEYNPSNTVALSNKGRLLANLGRMDEAIWFLEQAAGMSPHDAAAANDLETLLLSKSKVNDAARPMRAALDKHPENPKLHNQLGVFLEKSGYALTAAQHYEAAIQIQPDFVEALNNLGLVSLHQKDYDKAKRMFQRAYAVNPLYIPSNYNMACLLAYQNRPQEAIEWLKKCIDLGYSDRQSFLKDKDLKNLWHLPEMAELARGENNLRLQK